MPEIYRGIVAPFLYTKDSETWHIRARKGLHAAESIPLINPFTLKIVERIANQGSRVRDERLKITLGSVELENPVLVGAGWDKPGEAVRGLYAMGFSGVEVGSVLALSQYGNEKPRQFMVAPGVALNRLGFNTPEGGLSEVSHNLEKYRGSGIPIGVSIGKNKDVSIQNAPLAHAIVAARLYEDASYFVINVSSPNTPGLRQLQDKAPLKDIVQAVNWTMDIMGKRKPLFVKIAPDLENTAIDDVIEVVIDNGLTGIIATNTTINPDIKAEYGESWRREMGGLSGDNESYRRMATEKVRHIYNQTRGQIEIIGVGGVKNWETALEKIHAGAKAVQVVTAIRGEGPQVAGKINRGLVSYMDRIGIKDINELVGLNH